MFTYMLLHNANSRSTLNIQVELLHKLTDESFFEIFLRVKHFLNTIHFRFFLYFKGLQIQLSSLARECIWQSSFPGCERDLDYNFFTNIYIINAINLSYLKSFKIFKQSTLFVWTQEVQNFSLCNSNNIFYYKNTFNYLWLWHIEYFHWAFCSLCFFKF